MKKLLTLLLAAAMTLSLAACGGTPLTKDEMLEQSELAKGDFGQIAYEDPAAAEKQYGNQILRGYFCVGEIHEDHAVLVPLYDTSGRPAIVKAYLPTEELETLMPYQSIKVVGKFAKEITDAEYDTMTLKCFTMTTAYVVQDTMTWTGTVWSPEDELGENVYSIEIPGSVVLRHVYFREGEEVPYKYGGNGPTLKISGKEILGFSESAELHDAVIVEIEDE